MGCQSEVAVGANLTFTVASHNQGTGALADADAVPAYRIYEEETGTAILTGNMAKLDDAGTLGFYSEEIEATPANGFESGKSYAIYITIVVDGLTYAETYGLRAKTLTVTSGTAAINTTAVAEPNGFVLTTGSDEANNEDATHAEDGTTHDLEDTGGTTDAYYIFDVGGNGVPVSVTWIGYAQSQGDSYAIHAYNWSTPGWEQIGTIAGSPGSVNRTEQFDLTDAHVGTGTDLGLVHWRFVSADGTKFATDRILCSYAVVAQSVGYADGAIWIDADAGNTNTEIDVDGTARNPVSTWAAALSLNTTLGYDRFHVSNGTTITLTGDSSHYTFLGHAWTLALGGQTVTGMYAEDANISGTATGTGYRFVRCKLAIATATSLAAGGLKDCVIGSAGLTLSAAGTYLMKGCSAANGSVYIDFENAAEAKHLYMTPWDGDIEFRNFGYNGVVHTVSLTGQGHVTLNANCSNATADDLLDIHGMFHLTDSVVGTWGGTVDDDARIDVDQINAQVVDALNVDTYAEPGQEAPAATASLVTKIGHMFKGYRNKQTSDTDSVDLYNDAGDTVDQKRTLSDDGTTFVKGEVVSGP